MMNNAAMNICKGFFLSNYSQFFWVCIQDGIAESHNTTFLSSNTGQCYSRNSLGSSNFIFETDYMISQLSIVLALPLSGLISFYV